MKSYKRILLLLLIVLLLTTLLSPWVAWAWGLIIGSHPGWEEYRYTFTRIFNRMFYVLAVASLFIFRSRMKIGSPSELGLKPPRERYGDLLVGLFLSISSMAALVITMSLTDVFTPYFRVALPVALGRVFKALSAGLAAGFLEEILFRGIIFKGFLDDRRPVAAFVVANLLYAAIHFVKPREKFFLSELDPRAGMVHLIYSFQPFLDLANILPGLFGLLLIGVVLSYAFQRTGSLYLSIGLHTGWIFGLKTVRLYGDYSRADLGWLFGSSEPKIVSGLFSWIGILAVGAIVHLMTRERPILLLQGRSDRDEPGQRRSVPAHSGEREGPPHGG